LGDLRKLLVLSIWNDLWSLGEGSGVPDERYFIKKIVDAGIELHYLIPESADSSIRGEWLGAHIHTYGNVFHRARILPPPVSRLTIPYIFPLSVYGKLRRTVERICPDMLLGFSHYSIEPLSRIGRQMGIPTAVKLFGVMYLGRKDLPRLRRWWLNFDQERALKHPLDGYIVLNDGTMGDRALAARGIPDDRIEFLPNGMSLEWMDMDVDADSVRAELGLPLDKILIVSVSRLVKLKRVDLLVEAVSRIGRETREKAALVITGDGPEKQILEEMARRLGIADMTYFIGAVPYDSMPRLLKSCDIFAATSELTNMSMPTCEAMLCGLPVAAFDVAGTSETVINGKTGLLIEGDDIAGMAAALERLVLDGGLRKELGNGAAAFAAGHFMSWEERTTRELEILKNIACSGDTVKQVNDTISAGEERR
jgi:glycosyltransferase involved in cell wall biosynthesis